MINRQQYIIIIIIVIMLMIIPKIIVTVNQGQPSEQSRLPGQSTAESKLATLRDPSSNSTKPQ
jgi:hypothetical protein